MLIPGHDVHQEYVLGLRVESCDFDFVAGEHSPGGKMFRREKKTLTFQQNENSIIKANYVTLKRTKE